MDANDKSNLPVLYVDRAVMLPDKGQWENRFEINSETSDRVYVIAQNKSKRFWGTRTGRTTEAGSIRPNP